MSQKNGQDRAASKGDENEGEGSRSAARAYNEAATRFAQSGKGETAAREAAAALDSDEGQELQRAEDEGRRRAAEEDPEVRRPRVQ